MNTEPAPIPYVFPTPCDIEIVERTRDAERENHHGIVCPNEVRINGKPVPLAAGHAVVVHPIDPHDDLSRATKVTLTVFARTVSIRHETATED